MRVSTVRRVCVCMCGGKVALHFKRLAKVRISCSITYVQWVASYHSPALPSSLPLYLSLSLSSLSVFRYRLCVLEMKVQ